jgi:hypothetical protein
MLPLRAPRMAAARSRTMNINPQIISAVESAIIQSVQGTVRLESQAKELLMLDRTLRRPGGARVGISGS